MNDRPTRFYIVELSHIPSAMLDGIRPTEAFVWLGGLADVAGYTKEPTLAPGPMSTAKANRMCPRFYALTVELPVLVVPS